MNSFLYETDLHYERVKDILPWNISKMLMKTIPISTRIAISYAMEQDISFSVWRKVNGNWDNNMIKISQGREGNCKSNATKERKKSKRAGLGGSQSVTQVEKLTIWVRSFEIRAVRSWMLKSPKTKHISTWVDWEYLIYVKKSCTKTKVTDRGKRRKTLHEVQPVENINKKPQSFLELCREHKKVLHVDCKAMYMSNRILYDYRKTKTLHREISRISWVIQGSHIVQECQESLIQGKIHIQQNLIYKDLKYW